MLPNLTEFAIAYYGVLRAGGIVVPMNVLLKQREVAYYLSDPAARLVFAWHEFAEAAQAGAEHAGADCVLVEPGSLASSRARRPGRRPTRRRRHGGDPVHVGHHRHAEGRGADAREPRPQRRGVRADAAATSVPRTSCSARCRCSTPSGRPARINAAVASGAALALVPRFRPRTALETIERHRVTMFAGVPTMYAALLNHAGARAPPTCRRLRCCVVRRRGAAGRGAARLRAEFGCVVLEGYGLSETSPVACFNHPDRERLPGSIGTPIEGSRCVSSTRTATACRRARWARSRSAVTT